MKQRKKKKNVEKSILKISIDKINFSFEKKNDPYKLIIMILIIVVNINFHGINNICEFINGINILL